RTLLILSLAGWSSARLADKCGRVKMLQISILWYSFFAFLCAFAINFETLFALRALHGLGFVFWVRRHIDEPEIFKERAADRAQIGTSHLFAAFRAPHSCPTLNMSPTPPGAQPAGS